MYNLERMGTHAAVYQHRRPAGYSEGQQDGKVMDFFEA